MGWETVTGVLQGMNKIPKIKEKSKGHRIGTPGLPKRLYTVREAAHYLGLGVDTVRDMIYSKTFRIIQRGKNGKILLDVREIDRWIDESLGYA